MRPHVILYGLLAGVLIALLRFIEYRWLVVEHSIEIYGGLVAATFAGLGLWLGQRLTRRRPPQATLPAPAARADPDPAVTPAATPAPAHVPDEARRLELGITPRELEILGLIAAGLSNKEIGLRLHVSENTVKTHSSRLFDKLGARRRTQAVQRGQALRLIP